MAEILQRIRESDFFNRSVACARTPCFTILSDDLQNSIAATSFHLYVRHCLWTSFLCFFFFTDAECALESDAIQV